MPSKCTFSIRRLKFWRCRERWIFLVFLTLVAGQQFFIFISRTSFVMEEEASPPGFALNVNLTQILNATSCYLDRKPLKGDLQGNCLEPSSILARTEDCRTYFGYLPSIQVRTNSSNFPLAFTHSIIDQPGILEALLAVYFRPWDVHCIHVSQLASPMVFRVVKRLVKCYKTEFPSAKLFMTKHQIPVFLQDGSYLNSHMKCLDILRHLKYSWKMWIHLSPGDFPLRTIDDLRESLRSHGKSVIDIRANTRADHQLNYWHLKKIGPDNTNLEPVPLTKMPQWSPCNVVVAQGDPCVALTRDDVHTLFETPVGLQLYFWFQNTRAPEQHLFATYATISVLSSTETGNEFIPTVYTIRQSLTPAMTATSKTCMRDFHWYKGQRRNKSEEGETEEDHYNLLRLCTKVNDTCEDPGLQLETLQGETVGTRGPFFDEPFCLRNVVYPGKACQDNGELKPRCHLKQYHLSQLRLSRCFFGSYFDLNVSPITVLCQLKKLISAYQ